MTRTVSSSEQAFPWPQVMRFGLGELQLSPHDFWAMSLPELNAALSHHYPTTSSTPSRTELVALMQRNPDEVETMSCDQT